MTALLSWSEDRPERGTWAAGRLPARRPRLTVICSWCSRTLVQGRTDEVTHTICLPCERDVMAGETPEADDG